MIEYKFFGNAIIPRSAYIKKRIYNALKHRNEFIVNYYRGKAPDSKSPLLDPASFIIEPSESLYNQIQELNLFKIYKFDFYSKTKNILRDEQLLHYSQTLTLCALFFALKGAIAFDVDILSRKLEISLLEVEKNSQRNGYGEILLHAAILAGILFGCDSVYLESTTKSVDFYEKQGFIKSGTLNRSELQPMILNLSDIISLDKIQSRLKQTSPELDLSKELTAARKKIDYFSSIVQNRSFFSPQEVTDLKLPPHMIRQPIYTPHLNRLDDLARAALEFESSDDENSLKEELLQKRALPPHEERPSKHRKL